MHSDDPATCWEANAETWTRQAREGYDVYRDALNTPAFLAMLPPVAGLRGLDVGCGEGGNTRRVAGQGARMTAVDFAPTFIRHARESEAAEPLGIEYHEASAFALPFADGSFDFATAFMSIMDTGDPLRAMAEVFRVIRPGGFFQFSIIHPCFGPPYRKVQRDEKGEPYAVTVADYFATGAHTEEWHFGAASEEERKTVKPFRVPYIHLTLSGWLNGLRKTGFILDEVGEPMASEEVARQVPVVSDTRITPLFLHLRAVKPLTSVAPARMIDGVNDR